LRIWIYQAIGAAIGILLGGLIGLFLAAIPAYIVDKVLGLKVLPNGGDSSREDPTRWSGI
jgi:hypothetical protein